MEDFTWTNSCSASADSVFAGDAPIFLQTTFFLHVWIKGWRENRLIFRCLQRWKKGSEQCEKGQSASLAGKHTFQAYSISAVFCHPFIKNTYPLPFQKASGHTSAGLKIHRTHLITIISVQSSYINTRATRWEVTQVSKEIKFFFCMTFENNIMEDYIHYIVAFSLIRTKNSNYIKIQMEIDWWLD